MSFFFLFFLVKFSKDAAVVFCRVMWCLGREVDGLRELWRWWVVLLRYSILAEGVNRRLHGTLLQVPNPGSRVRYGTGLR